MGPKVTSRQVAKAGQHFVAARLYLGGARDVRFVVDGQRTELRVADATGRLVAALKVKTKRAGTWQPSLREAQPLENGDVPRYWVLVELSGDGDPAFFVVPEPWIQRDIRDAHEASIARHGGHREHTPDSLHHALPRNRVEQWRERWDLIGLTV
jgi:hypothetical protein